MSPVVLSLTKEKNTRGVFTNDVFPYEFFPN